MILVDEFRDRDVALRIARVIGAEARPERSYAFMEFCGGHTHAIFRYAIEDLLPANIRMVHGPGCPVCVLPIGRIDAAIALAGQPGVTLCTYGDVLRVPGSHRRSLLKAKAEGADIRVVYSPMDAVKLAQASPDRQVVFLAVGFETTTPPTAVVVLEAERLGLANFSVFCNHVLTPPAIAAILDSPEAQGGALRLDGIIGPAHVSAVTGSRAFARFPRDYGQPVVITGFEPLDVLQAILMLVRQANAGRGEIENQFTRGVTEDGNRHAQGLMARVFESRETFAWRGLGQLPASGIRLRPEFAAWDAERRFSLPEPEAEPPTACRCGAILRGLARPADCRLFGTGCTPDNPIGACMVSSEGACAAEWAYGRARHRGKETA
jgi:hydrogenase expression/formation protein HypD